MINIRILMEMFKSYRKLTKDYVENGIVLKSNEIVFDRCNNKTADFIKLINPFISRYIKLNTDDISTKIIVSNLILEPNAKIKYHVHKDDSEFYIILKNDGSIEVRYCKKGEGHELENNTLETLEVLSVKIVDSI